MHAPAEADAAGASTPLRTAPAARSADAETARGEGNLAAFSSGVRSGVPPRVLTESCRRCTMRVKLRFV